MPYILAGFLIFWLLLSGLQAFARANPVTLARLIKRGGGYLALLVAVFFLFQGRIDVALVLGVMGFWLIGLSRRTGKFFSRRSATARGRSAGISRVRSAMIEMELEQATGEMFGTILAGPEEGKSLDQMIRPQCEALYRLCLRDDPEGARLLEVYLDRRFPGWRTARDKDQDPGAGEVGGAARQQGAMSEDEAYEVLGLHKGASRDEVMRSHRSLIKKLHPDHGGSTDLAARVNEAKDVLMRRHQ